MVTATVWSPATTAHTTETLDRPSRKPAHNSARKPPPRTMPLATVIVSARSCSGTRNAVSPAMARSLGTVVSSSGADSAASTNPMREAEPVVWRTNHGSATALINDPKSDVKEAAVSAARGRVQSTPTLCARSGAPGPTETDRRGRPTRRTSEVPRPRGDGPTDATRRRARAWAYDSTAALGSPLAARGEVGAACLEG